MPRLVVLLLATATAAAGPAVRLLPGYSQVENVAVPGGTSKGGTVQYLGTFNGSSGTSECQAACVATVAPRCWSFSHYPAGGGGGWAGEYKIRVAATGKQLQADDLADMLLSTRYQTDDDYSRFVVEMMTSGGTGGDAGGEGMGEGDAGFERAGTRLRFRVKADSRLLVANNGSATAGLPAYVVSASSDPEAGNGQFVVTRVAGSDGEGGSEAAYTIQTSDGRYWSVDPAREGIVFTAPSRNASHFTFSPVAAAGGLAGQCFAVLSPGFNPSWDPAAVSGILSWPCRTDDDCSLNGVCNATTLRCNCRPAWTGERCQRLNLQAPTRGAGYRGVDGGRNTSSWGGAVLKGADGRYHMWAAEMTEHCGIGAWQQNSRVIHATSSSPGGVFTRKDVTWEVFSHEPEVVPGPDGEFIMYFTADLRSQHGRCNCCRPGHGPCDGSTGPGDCSGATSKPAGALRGGSDSYMSFTRDPDGNWSTPVKIFADYRGGDTNFAPLILANGSIVAMWRHWGGGNGGSRQFLATAADWRDPSTYVQHHTELFPDLGAAGTEDQFLYMDGDGHFHAVFHHMYGTGTKTQWWLDATGGHAFSRNGWNWTYTGVAWGNATSRYNTPEGQGAKITFTDGRTNKFTRLERPHLVFESDQLRGDPIYLTNSAQYGDGTNPGAASHNDDACYTLIRPVQQ